MKARYALFALLACLFLFACVFPCTLSAQNNVSDENREMIFPEVRMRIGRVLRAEVVGADSVDGLKALLPPASSYVKNFESESAATFGGSKPLPKLKGGSVVAVYFTPYRNRSLYIFDFQLEVVNERFRCVAIDPSDPKSPKRKIDKMTANEVYVLYFVTDKTYRAPFKADLIWTPDATGKSITPLDIVPQEVFSRVKYVEPTVKYLRYELANENGKIVTEKADHFFRFDANVDKSKAQDDVTKRSLGTLGTDIKKDAGIFNDALDFEKTGWLKFAPNEITGNYGRAFSEFSISFWLRPMRTPLSTKTIYEHVAENGRNKLFFGQKENKIIVQFATDQTPELTLEGDLVRDSWNLVTLNVCNGRIELFVNDKLAKSRPISGSFKKPDTPIFIGRSASRAGENDFTGRIDEFGFFKMPLLDTEVKFRFLNKE